MTDAGGRVRTISPEALAELLLSDEEHALVDAREIDVFAARHLLFAVPLPLGRLEVLAPDLLPRRALPIVVCDGGEGLAERAAARLEQLGYSDVAVLEGGLDGWERAGYETYSGVNVPSKAFGEFVEHAEATPSLDAEEVHRMMVAGEDLVILDSRPFAEFQWASIPTGRCCAGAELVYRAFSAVPSADTKVVVNCAGRTRSIIGAQSLINAGLPNEVFALRNGIMGWRLAGLEPASGESSRVPGPDEDGLARSRAAARRVASRFGVQAISRDELDVWRGERDARALYVLDVRTAEEYEQGHLADAVHAPGGQVVQATDEFVGARNARIVLVDDDGVRAAMTASWLIQMGQRDVRSHTLDGAEEVLVAGPRPATVLGFGETAADAVSAAEAQRMQADGALVLDVGRSPAYRAGHVPGAWFVLRSQLEASLAALPDATGFVVTSEDGALAVLAAVELEALVDVPVRYLAGGNDGWQAAGHALVREDARFAAAPVDVWRNPFVTDRAEGETVEDAMRAYLRWEVDLIDQLGRDGTTRFRAFAAADDR